MGASDGGSLTISVKAFTEGVAASFDSLAATCRQWANTTSQAFAGVNAASKETAISMVADTNAAAEGTAAAWNRVAEASVAYRQAQREVRNASRDTIALAAGEENAINRLAVAKQRLAAASTELAAAQKATTVATEEEAASFGLLSTVLGPLIEGALILEYVNHLKESTLETSHLSEATGISVVELTEMKAAMQAAGVSTERLPQQLTKLAKAIELASEGNKTAQHQFHQLGISTDEWKDKIPGLNDVIMQMAHHLHGASGGAQQLAAAANILGRGSAQMVAWLKEGDDAIRKQEGSFKNLGEAVAANVTSARELQGVETALSNALKTNLLPVFQFLVKGIVSVAAALDLMEGAFDVAKEYVKSWIVAVSHGLHDFKKAIEDLATGGGLERFSKLAKKAVDDMAKDITVGADKVEKIWGEAFDKANKHFTTFVDAVDKGDDHIIGDAGKAAKSRVSVWQEGLNQQKLALDAFHNLTLAQELAFWQKIKSNNQHASDDILQIDDQTWKKLLVTTKKSREEQLSVDNEILKLRKGIAKQAFDDEISKMNLELAATKQGSQARIALLQKDLIELRNEGKQETAAYKEKEKELTEAKKQFGEERRRINQQLDMEEANFSERMALLELQGRKDAFAAEVTAHQKKSKEVVEQEKAFAAEEHRIIVAAINAKLKALEKDPDLNVVERKRLHNQIIVEDQRFQNELNKIEEKGTKRRKDLEQGVAQAMQSSMSSAMMGIIQGTETLTKAFEQMGTAILGAFVNSLSQMVTEFMEREILMKVFKLATEKEKAMAGIKASAAQAGAAGTASWAGAPWPIDAGAPGFGQAMFDAAAAYSAFGIAERGALVPRNMPILAHAEEMILPARLSRGIQGMIDGGGASGGINISPTLNASAMDTSGLVPVLDRFKRQLVRELKAAVANNRLNLKTI